MEDHHFPQLKAADHRCDDLVVETVERAGGISLQAFLVVQSLRRGL